MDQARDWAVRMVHESEWPRKGPDGAPRGAWFCTLTYSPENVPEHGSLCPEDLRGFFARLRSRYPAGTVTYYAVGEYGTFTQRPHYHAVLFGPRFLDRAFLTRRFSGDVWIPKALKDAWGLGLVEATAFSPATALYVAGYVAKKMKAALTPAYHDELERVVPETGEVVRLVPEFARMSRRPAVGRRWFEEFWKEVYPNDFVLLDGRPMKPPRYYDKLLEELDADLAEEVRAQRQKDAEEIGDEKLIMKEKVHRARMRLFSKRGKV